MKNRDNNKEDNKKMSINYVIIDIGKFSFDNIRR